MIKTDDTPLLYTSSNKIEGLLSLESAYKHQIGLFESITLETYAALKGYESHYTVLTDTRNWLLPYQEFYTKIDLAAPSKRIIRAATDQPYLSYTGNDSQINILTKDKLNQIFPEAIPQTAGCKKAVTSNDEEIAVAILSAMFRK